jgi:hypothetical protein
MALARGVTGSCVERAGNPLITLRVAIASRDWAKDLRRG